VITLGAHLLICVSTDCIFRTYYHTSNFFSHTHFILVNSSPFKYSQMMMMPFISVFLQNNNQPNTNVERDVYYSSTYYKA